MDLIAVRRQKNRRGTSLLHELLDELDGMPPESQTVVIMTTNRPDVLEPALASRPGRVSQAIQIGLPNAECRRRILELFTARLNVADIRMDHWVERTNGASPAFLEELIRRSILFSRERAPDANPVPLSDGDLNSAIQEIVTSGGILTQKLLGYAET
ncbi:MAG: AAA family ATPase [Planctomycetaceae bacterium]